MLYSQLNRIEHLSHGFQTKGKAIAATIGEIEVICQIGMKTTLAQ